jgi:hypothetical protein
VVSAKAVGHAGMHGAGVNEVRKSHLVNAAKALVKRMTDHPENKRVINADESINGVVDDFTFVTHSAAKFGEIVRSVCAVV